MLRNLNLGSGADSLTVLQGDCRETLKQIPDGSCQMAVTSPPYWGLRSYLPKGHPDKAREIGQEKTPELYVATIVDVFREVRRCLHDSGVLFLNLGDSYNGSSSDGGKNSISGGGALRPHGRSQVADASLPSRKIDGLKPKDLCGIPWRVVLALQEPYYTGRIKSVADRRWLAAAIDGEGSIYIHKRGAGLHAGNGYVRKSDTYGAGIDVGNTSEAFVRECQRIAGVGAVYQQQGKTRSQFRPMFSWRVQSDEAKQVLREIYPYLIIKQQQARLAFSCPNSGKDAEMAHAALKLLHRGSETTADLAAPTSCFEQGWWLRSIICWAKKSCMPESVTDRPTNSWEPIFLLAKRASYFYDCEAIKEPAAYDGRQDTTMKPSDKYSARNIRNEGESPNSSHTEGAERWPSKDANGVPLRNMRNVWSLSPEPFPGSHFATFPTEIPRRAILAGTSARGCCPKCGAPWTRIVEQEKIKRDDVYDGSKFKDQDSQFSQKRIGMGVKAGRALGLPHDNPVFPTRTVGWQPGCECYEWHKCAECGEKMDAFNRKYGDAMPCGHNLCAECVIQGAAIDHECTMSPIPCTVLDPFGGSGTTGEVALELGRRAILCELNPNYLPLIKKRTAVTTGLQLA